jgi:Reverse transcriptase (RNA-dependent DNA polymerase)
MYVQSKGIIRGKFYGDFYEYIVNIGVKQGDGASPELFTIFFDRVYPYLKAYYQAHAINGNKRCAYTIASLQLFLLAFADDVVLLAPSPE